MSGGRGETGEVGEGCRLDVANLLGEALLFGDGLDGNAGKGGEDSVVGEERVTSSNTSPWSAIVGDLKVTRHH